MSESVFWAIVTQLRVPAGAAEKLIMTLPPATGGKGDTSSLTAPTLPTSKVKALGEPTATLRPPNVCVPDSALSTWAE